MSKKIKLQDLSIANFEQQPDVEGIKGGRIKLCVHKTTHTCPYDLYIYRGRCIPMTYCDTWLYLPF